MPKVLIADDNPPFRHMLEKLLEAHGFEPQSAENGALALAAVRRDPPDLVISDILMPEMDGFEFCRQMKADPALRAIPFLFYSSVYTDPSEEAFARSLGADAFLSKPQATAELVRVAEDLLASARAESPTPPAGADATTYLRQRDAILSRKLEHKVRDLHDAEGRFTRLFHAMSDAFAQLDPQGRILDANPAFHTLFGRNPEELVELDPSELAADGIWPPVAPGGAPSFECEYRRKDGSRFPAETRVVRFQEDPARPSGLWLILRDITERRQAEARLRQAADTWQATFDALRDAVWVLDEQHRIVQANAATRTLFGREPREVVGRRCWEIVHDTLAPIPECPTERMLRSNQREVEVLALGERTFQIQVDPIHDAAGKRIGAIHVVRDITESARQERELRAQEQRLRETLESMGDAFVSLDHTWHYTYVNRRAGELFGRDPASLVGRHIWTEFPEGLGQPFQRAYERAMQERVAITLEDHYEPWDQWFENRIYPTPEGIAIFFSNITERRRAALAVQKEQAKLAALVETIPDVVWFKDPDGTYRFGNHRLEQLLGRPVAQILGATDADLLDPVRAAEAASLDQACLEADAPLVSEGWLTFAASGERGLFETVRTPVRDGTGSRLGLLGIARDVTHIREAGERLELALAAGRAGVWDWDIPRDILTWDLRQLKLYGISPADFRTRYASWSERVHPEDRAVAEAALQRALRGEAPFDTQFRVVLPTGAVRTLRAQAHIQRAEDGTPLRAVGLNWDISEKVALERERDRMARLFATLAQANEAIVRAADEATLFREVCRTCVDPGGFDLAWVSRERSGDHGFEVLASDGSGRGFLEALAARGILEDSAGIHPPGICLREGRTVLCGPDSTEALDAGWIDQAQAVGLNACAALPLRRSGRVVGVLNLASRQEDFFAPDRLALLEKLSEDLSYALQHLASEAMRREVLESLQMSESRYRSLFNAESDALLLIDPATLAILDANPGAEHYYGYTRTELLQLSVEQISLHPEAARERIQRMEGAFQVPLVQHRRKDGSVFPVSIAASFIEVEGRRMMLSAIRDMSAQVRTQQEIEDQRAFLEGVFEGFPAPVWTVDTEGRYTSFNDLHRRTLLDVHGSEIRQGDRFLEKLPEGEERDIAAQNLRRALAGETLIQELRPGGDQGPGIVLHILHSPLRTLDGQVNGVVMVALDLTELRTTEQALAASERRARSIFETTSEGLALLDPDSMCFLDANPAFCRMYGYTREELLGLRAVDISEEPEQTREAIQGLFKRVDLRWHRRKDGSRFPVELLGDTFQEGPRTIFIVASRDITQRLEAEESAARRSRQFEALLDLGGRSLSLREGQLLEEGLEIAVAITSSHIGFLHFVLEDLETLALTQWSRETRKLCTAAFDTHYPIARAGIWADAFRLRRPVIHNDYPAQAAPGSLPEGHFPLRRELVVPVEEDGRVRMILGVGNRDTDYGPEEVQNLLIVAADLWKLVQRHRALAALREAKESLERRVKARTRDLEALNHELESFSYSVSHDLRTPLRHMDGFLDLLARHLGAQLDSRGSHYLETARRSAFQMGELIDDLLAFSRISRTEIRKMPVDANALVAELREELTEAIRGRTIHWQVEALPRLFGDPLLIRLVLQNLLDNAVKFTRNTPEARIEIRPIPDLEGEDGIEMRDNGSGFDPAYAHKLFGVFQRLHRPEEFEGTGIGLANAHRIVQRHGGRIWAEGRPGEGATFRFTLPARDAFGRADSRPGPYTDSSGGT